MNDACTNKTQVLVKTPPPIKTEVLHASRCLAKFETRPSTDPTSLHHT